MNDLTIWIDDKKVVVDYNFYVTAKTKDLIGFGYDSLTETEVDEQAQKVLDKDEDLSIIGQFIKRDIVLED